MKVAAISYRPERLSGWGALEARLDRLLSEAAADLVVLPEYAAMEAALMSPPRGDGALDWRDRAAEMAGDWAAQIAQLARKHGCTIVGGSGPARTPAGIVNRAPVAAPNGATGHQDKLILTPWEREELAMVPGTGLTLFDGPLGAFGVLVCYDSEFPLLARALVEAGACVLCVPSCTDLPAGQTRVRQSCRARAIEGQVAVVQAPLVGETACPVIDVNRGRAGIFVPPDTGLPETGILADGPDDREAVVTADLPLAALAGVSRARAGQVGNAAHWPEQADRLGVTRLPL